MLLELLKLVVGRLGGPPPAELVLETERIMAGGPGIRLPFSGVDDIGGVIMPMGGRGGPLGGGALARPASAPGMNMGVLVGGAGLELAERGMGGADLGGGGAAFLAVVSSGPAFLLTQRFWSGS